jgi:CTP synthase (UTP-ammonia lyase)
MKNYNAFKFILLASLMAVSCKVADTSESYFSFNEAVLKAQYTSKESVKLEIIDSSNKKIDSIVYSVNNNFSIYSIN